MKFLLGLALLGGSLLAQTSTQLKVSVDVKRNSAIAQQAYDLLTKRLRALPKVTIANSPSDADIIASIMVGEHPPEPKRASEFSIAVFVTGPSIPHTELTEEGLDEEMIKRIIAKLKKNNNRVILARYMFGGPTSELDDICKDVVSKLSRDVLTRLMLAEKQVAAPTAPKK